MFRSVRALVIAVIVAASLLGSASIASANTITARGHHKAPVPARLLDISWE